MSDISLTAGIRSNLLQLQQTSKQFDETTNRLATGKKVNSAIDNPTNFFAAVNLTDRAEGLSARLDGIGQSIQTIQAADNGISTTRGFLSAMKGVVNTAISETDSDARSDLGDQFNELINQINTVAKDSEFAGVNLIQNEDERGQTQTVQFNETFDDSTLDVDGFNIQASVASGVVSEQAFGDLDSVTAVTMEGVSSGVTGAGILLATQDSTDAVGIQYSDTAGGADATGANSSSVNFAGDNYKDTLANVIQQIEDFDTELKTQASSLANNLNTITTREEFTNNLVNTLNEGADKLTLADLNEEGANLLALQTSNQLATQSLSLASQQSQGVLQLIG